MPLLEGAPDPLQTSAGPPSVAGVPRTAPPVRKRIDLSRPAMLTGEASWDCPFPPEADKEQIDNAAVVLLVAVDATGKPTEVRVLVDPGHGFGRAAKACALLRTYKPALDAEGKPTSGSTPPISVKFSR